MGGEVMTIENLMDRFIILDLQGYKVIYDTYIDYILEPRFKTDIEALEYINECKYMCDIMCD